MHHISSYGIQKNCISDIYWLHPATYGPPPSNHPFQSQPHPTVVLEKNLSGVDVNDIAQSKSIMSKLKLKLKQSEL